MQSSLIRIFGFSPNDGPTSQGGGHRRRELAGNGTTILTPIFRLLTSGAEVLARLGAAQRSHVAHAAQAHLRNRAARTASGFGRGCNGGHAQGEDSNRRRSSALNVSDLPRHPFLARQAPL